MKPYTVPIITFGTMKWMVLTLFQSPDNLKKLLNDFWGLTKRLNTYVASSNHIEVADRVKEMRLAITSSVLGMPSLIKPGFKPSRDGLPTFMPVSMSEGISKGDSDVISMVLTILTMTRAIKGGKPMNLDPITEPSTGSEMPNLEPLISGFMKAWNMKPFNWEWLSFHFTTKAGPNGPALASALHDLMSLNDSQVEDISILGGEKLSEMVKWWSPWFDCDFGSKLLKVFHKMPVKLKTSKLSVKPDPEGKSSIFAILDYWSQCALKGLHHKTFSVLMGIHTDKTFNQTELLTELQPDPGSSYHSIDLSSATDRFPMGLQTELLSYIMGEDKAYAWSRLLINRDFDYDGTPISYNCGQPMGAYSSWPVFALTHHLVVYIAARNAGKFRFDNYVLLGDDIVIGNDDVAHEYKKLLVLMGVEYSPHKTLTSKKGFEFAKSLFINSEEYSPMSLPGFYETVKTWSLFAEFLNQLSDSGYYMKSLYRNPVAIQDLLFHLGVSDSLSQNLGSKVWVSLLLPKSSLESEVVGDFFKSVSQYFAVSWSCNFSLETMGLSGSIAMTEVLTQQTTKILEENKMVSMDYLKEVKSVIYESELLGSQGSVQSTALLQMDWFGVIPVVNVLSLAYGDSAWGTYYEVEDFLMEIKKPDHDPLTIWDKVSSPVMSSVPPTGGLVPDSASQSIAKTRGELISRFISYLRKSEICDMDDM